MTVESLLKKLDADTNIILKDIHDITLINFIYKGRIDVFDSAFLSREVKNFRTNSSGTVIAILEDTKND
ncbi:DUF1125 domain-containing protein [Lactococcus lactis subsp. lactis]|uniref:DUF1125 domain-containing protein n=1 Tax=Lactococcus lactis TaxID=1358 RepID=UPI00300E4B8B